MTLVSGLFKIVCATCPAHAVVHEQVRYQDGLLIHYECHGRQYLAAMYPYLSRVITHRDGTRYSYAFNVRAPDVSVLHEPVDCIYILDTELESLGPAKLSELHQHMMERLPIAEKAEKPNMYSDDEWKAILADARKMLDLLTRFREIT